MQQKIISTILFLFLTTNCAFAESKTSKTLSRIENNLFGIEYADNNDTERLSRIEEHVYGQTKDGSVKLRLENLSKDIATNQMGQEIEPKEDTFADDDNYYSQKTLAQSNQDEYYEPDNPKIEYPAVNELEEQIFGKTYKDLDINTRISKLEKETFRKTYNDALSDRVERLKNKTGTKNNSISTPQDYIPQENYYSQEDNYFSPQTVAQDFDNNTFKTQKTTQNNELTDKSLNSKLKKLEKTVFKQSFSNENTDARLSRLEGAIFNTNFSSDSNSTRLGRISSAVEAQKTAKKYDSNGLQQKMATAMQIGMFVLMVVAMIL